ncbi:hypothetical protein, partial [Actinomadura sp. NPDC049753]|uniref:hypothetical protein n=1 Tax=Actinomadura sp. NPDC049753 TaxID=3154739 RepID=UPI00343C4DF6
MSELNGSGGSRGVPDAATPWPAMGRDPGGAQQSLPSAQQPIQMAKPGQPAQAGLHGQTGEIVRPDVEQAEAQPWDIVERLRQMADLIGDALAAGERKVNEAQTETAAQIAAVQAEKESAQRDAAAAWGEVQRARGQAEQADRRAVEAERRVTEAQTESAAQIAAVQAEKESAQRDAAAAWGEVQRARG